MNGVKVTPQREGFPPPQDAPLPAQDVAQVRLLISVAVAVFVVLVLGEFQRALCSPLALLGSCFRAAQKAGEWKVSRSVSSLCPFIAQLEDWRTQHDYLKIGGSGAFVRFISGSCRRDEEEKLGILRNTPRLWRNILPCLGNVWKE